MMATTHALVGLALAAGVATVAPELAVPAAVGGIAGGLAPDLDVLATHRRTLHAPIYGAVPAALAAVPALWQPGALTVGVATLLLAAWLHAVADAFGGPPEANPWATDTDRTVYAHALGRWLPRLGGVRYDGAPEDFLLGVALAVPVLLVFDGAIAALVWVGLAVSFGYALFRRPIGERLAAS